MVVVRLGCLVVLVLVACASKAEPPDGGSPQTSTSTGPASTSSGTTTSTGAPPASSGAAEEGSSGFVCSGQPDGYCAAKAEQQANAYILENHSAAEGSHAIRITQDHVMACAAREYDIRGDADHSHVFTLFEGHFGLLDVGGSIELDSTEANGHTHVLWADCE